MAGVFGGSSSQEDATMKRYLAKPLDIKDGKTGKRVSLMIVVISIIWVMGMLVAPVSSSAATQHLGEYGVGNFDEFVVTASDPIFAAPGFSDFTDWSYIPVADWAGTFVSANFISASGGTRDNLVFAMSFDDAYAGVPFSFEFYAFDNSVLRDWTTVSYNGLGITDGNYDNWSFDTHPVPAVPEPSTMLLLGAGLAGLGVWGRKKMAGKT